MDEFFLFFPNDQDLLEALRKGDRSLWDRAYRKFKSRVLGVLKGLGAPREEALTFYHDAWLVFDQRKFELEFGRTRGKIRAFLTTTAKYKFHEWLRKRPPGPPTIRYDAGGEDEPLLPGHLAWLADEESPVLRNLFRDINRPCEELLEDALREMDRTHCREIIKGVYWHELKLYEIAKDVGKTYGHIRDRRTECIRDLRKRLQRVGYDEKCL
jgi:RNA polymerase sigma factor (sigma-70 family)